MSADPHKEFLTRWSKRLPDRLKVLVGDGAASLPIPEMSLPVRLSKEPVVPAGADFRRELRDEPSRNGTDRRSVSEAAAIQRAQLAEQRNSQLEDQVIELEGQLRAAHGDLSVARAQASEAMTMIRRQLSSETPQGVVVSVGALSSSHSDASAASSGGHFGAWMNGRISLLVDDQYRRSAAAVYESTSEDVSIFIHDSTGGVSKPTAGPEHEMLASLTARKVAERHTEQHLGDE